MYKTIKTMRQALAEARAYRDPVNEDRGFSTQQIKMAYGILNDPRYKQGNYSGAVSAIEKIAKGLSDHPDVANALRRANEELDKDDEKSVDGVVKQLKKAVKAHQGQVDTLTKDLKDEKDLEERVSKQDAEKFDMAKYKENERDNQHSDNALLLVKKFGTAADYKKVVDIDIRHQKAGSISMADLKTRNDISRKYIGRLM